MLDKLFINKINKELWKFQDEMHRAYPIDNGDIFTIAESKAIHAMQCSNRHHIFMPLERYKAPIWYRPSTWFRWLWKVQYIEYEEGEPDDN